MAWMIIRVRGTIHSRHDIRDTLEHLHLNRPNHATIVPERKDYKGMLSTVQGYVTWGEAEPETVAALLTARGETYEGGPIAANVKEATGAEDISTLTRAVLEKGLARADGLRPLFRLKAPTGGWRSTKKPFSLGGSLGYRGRAINDLAKKML
jgi:large subunit ribosomal protein L30